MSPREPISNVNERFRAYLHSIHWFRTDSFGNLLPTWARLGPLSVNQQGAARSHRRFDRDCFRRDRSPNGVAWRFPDWTAVGFAFPSPFLGSRSLWISVTRILATCWARFDHDRGSLSPRLVKPLAAILTRIASGVFFAVDFRVALSLAADFRRARYPLLRTDLAWKVGLRIRSLFLFRRALSCPTTRGNIITSHKTPKKFPQP